MIVRGHAGQQDLLDCPLERAQGEALLEQTVGLLLVEGAERRRHPIGGRWSLATLAGQRDRRRDVVGLGQRQPERLNLGQGILTMPTGRTVWLGKAVAPLPAAERVGTD